MFENVIVSYSSGVPVPAGEVVGAGIAYAGGDEGWKLATVIEMVVPPGIVPPLGNVIDPVIPATVGNAIAVPVVSGTVVDADIGDAVPLGVAVGDAVLGLGVGDAAPLEAAGTLEVELPLQPAIAVAPATNASPRSRNGTTKPECFIKSFPQQKERLAA